MKTSKPPTTHSPLQQEKLELPDKAIPPARPYQKVACLHPELLRRSEEQRKEVLTLLQRYMLKR